MMKKRKRFVPVPVPEENDSPAELRVDPNTGALLHRKETSRILWSRNNKIEAEERLQFYAPVSLALRVHRYVRSQGPGFTLGRFLILAVHHYLDSKGQ